jgi:hypothetical protein
MPGIKPGMTIQSKLIPLYRPNGGKNGLLRGCCCGGGGGAGCGGAG